jgi:hypothetical protein
MHYEHSLAEIMEHFYAVSPQFGLAVYQMNTQNPLNELSE